MFTSIAYAAAGAPGGAGDAGSPLLQVAMPMVLMFAVFYFLLIRPQQKRNKQHRAMLEALKKGDHVLTSSGFMGRIVEIDSSIILLDLGETKVRIPRGYISGTYDPKELSKVEESAPTNRS